MRQFILLLSLLLLCTPLAAEEVKAAPLLRIERSQLTHGMRLVQAEQITQGGSFRAQMLELNLAAERTSLAAQLSQQGYWKPQPLGRFAMGGDAVGAISVATSRDSALANFDQGLLFTEGTLSRWPALPGPVLLISADGRARLDEFAFADYATITADSGASWTLTSINGPPAPGISLYSGALASNSRELMAWPEGTVAFPVRPATENLYPAAALWDSSLAPEQRAWRPGSPLSAVDLSLSVREWALIVAPGVKNAAALAKAGTLVIDVPLPAEIRHAHFAVNAGAWRMRDGKTVAADLITNSAQRTYFATDQTGERVWMVQSGTGIHQFAFPQATMTEVLSKQGAYHITEFSAAGIHPLLIPSQQLRRNLPFAGPSSRVALLAVPREPELNLGGVELAKLEVAWVVGSDSSEAQHRPEAAADGEILASDGLHQFWAAPLPAHVPGEPRRQWLEIGLTEPAFIKTVDLFHAELSGFSRHFDLAKYRLLGRESRHQPWRELAVVEHEEPAARDRIRVEYPRKLDGLRIEVIQPNFLPEGEVARLSEVIIWGRMDSSE